MRPRTASVDVVRGTVMVIMALDHVRDFVTNQRIQPEDLSRAGAALFATRWITHFCAPTFFLLAGVGAGLSMARGKSAPEMSRFLAVRGVWLVVLDLFVNDFAWRFFFHGPPFFGIVLWALGWSMIALAALVRMPRMAIATISLAMIALHNLADSVPPAAFGSLAWLWSFLHAPGFAFGGKLFIAYPVIPWIGVMGLGFVLADVFAWEPARRRRLLLWSGLGATALFIALRATNGYGNPFPWTAQRSVELTVASFLNVTKYPPSLQFLLMTLGPTLVALSLLEDARGRVARWLDVYGRVPLFYYMGHIVVGHVVALALMFAQLGGLRPLDPFAGTAPSGFGVGLPGVYLCWAVVVALMFWPCRWYADLKSRRDDWWLRYT